jgi:hypothetical protein
LLGRPESQAAAKEKYQKAVDEWEQKIAQLDTGLRQEWFNPQLDESNWKTMELPGIWENTEMGAMDGIVWFRRTTNLPPSGRAARWNYGWVPSMMSPRYGSTVSRWEQPSAGISLAFIVSLNPPCMSAPTPSWSAWLTRAAKAASSAVPMICESARPVRMSRPAPR